MVDVSNLPMIDKLNAFYGTCLAVLSYFLGDHWFLFAGLLIFNVIDYVTGCIKAYLNGEVNSVRGMKGLVKKFSQWIMVLVAFLMSYIFIEIGEVIGVNLHVSTYIGWFVLGSLIINEARSILENLIACEGDTFKVPRILVKGLEAAEKVFDDEEDDRIDS